MVNCRDIKKIVEQPNSTEPIYSDCGGPMHAVHASLQIVKCACMMMRLTFDVTHAICTYIHQKCIHLLSLLRVKIVLYIGIDCLYFKYRV